MGAALTQAARDGVDGGPPLSHRYTVLAGPHAPRAARHVLMRLRWVPIALLDTAALLLTELVTNSVRHAGLGPHDRIVVRVECAGGRLRVEVTDGGSGFTPPARPGGSFPEPGGMGLMLVDKLASSWSVERQPRTRVWFELKCAVGAVSAGATRP